MNPHNTCIVIDKHNRLTDPRLSYIFRLFAKELNLTPYEHRCDIDDDYLYSVKAPDLIILYHASTYREWQLLKRTKELWGDQPFIVTSTNESYDVFHDLSDFAVSYRQYNKKHDSFNTSWVAYGPYIEEMINLRGGKQSKAEFIDACDPFVTSIAQTLRAGQEVKRLLDNPKDKFCSFVTKNRNLKYPGVLKRNKLVRLLSNYKKVECGGRMMNNTQDLWKLEGKYDRSFAKIEFLSHHKFNVAFENRKSPFYITEKILDALLAGSIPIYWGTKEVSKLINPKAFINCGEYDSIHQVVERVKEIDNNPDLYKEYTEAPVFLDNSLVYDMRISKLKETLCSFVPDFKEHQQQVANQALPSSGKPQKKQAVLPINMNNQLLSHLDYRIRKLKGRLGGSEK